MKRKRTFQEQLASLTRWAAGTLIFLVATLLPRYSVGDAFPEAVVISVHDGDTVSLKMNGRVYRSRLIGIDAPEMGQEPWGKKAREYLRKSIKEFKGRVLVETDIVRYDKYDRLLVYLWTPDGSMMLNESMLRSGYAFLFTIQPNSKHVRRFVEAQRIAKRAGAGVWGPDGPKERPLDYKKAHPRT